MIARTARRLDHRTKPLWLAALLHRLSGLGLALFLPLHFLTLGLAIDGEGRLESFLRWSDAPMVRIGEAALIFLLAVHAFGGLRLLAVETLGWQEAHRQERQARIAALAAGMALAIAVAFLAWMLHIMSVK